MDNMQKAALARFTALGETTGPDASQYGDGLYRLVIDGDRVLVLRGSLCEEMTVESVQRGPVEWGTEIWALAGRGWYGTTREHAASARLVMWPRSERPRIEVTTARHMAEPSMTFECEPPCRLVAA